jgi:hypothetical protein
MVLIDSVNHTLAPVRRSLTKCYSEFDFIAFVFADGFSIAVSIGNQDSAAFVALLVSFDY